MSSSQQEALQVSSQVLFHALISANLRKCNADLAAYHNMYSPLDCIRNRIEAGDVEHCVCFSSPAPTKSKKKKKKQSKKNKQK